MINSTLTYSFIMTAAGLGIPIMGALNGGLGTKLESTAIAAVILLFTSLVIAIIYLFTVEGAPPSVYAQGTPWYFYLGGFFVTFYILSITWVAPRFGIGNAVSFVLLGQLIAMSIIDHFGLFGSQQISLNSQRLIGLFLMAVGIFIALNKTSAATDLT